MDRIWSRFKLENHSLLWEAETREELRAIVDRQMTYYNQKGRHSRPAYQSPLEYLHQEGMLPSRVSRK